MSDIRRVIVTGSRTWDDEQKTADVLHGIRRDALRDGADGIVVVHGDRPGGADALAAAWCTANGVPAEAHPADEETGGRDAEYLRNQQMVAAGADVCLVFVGPCTSSRCRRPKPHDSHDANACAELAANAGMAVRKWTTTHR